MDDVKFFGVTAPDVENFLEQLNAMRSTGDLRCLAELRVRTGAEETVWGYGVNGIIEWSRTTAYDIPDSVSSAVIRGDGWQWEIESIEWIGAISGTFQFIGYARPGGSATLQRVRLLWQLIW